MPPSLSGIELKKKWKLGRLIGSGGCAEVYEVVDLRSSGGEELVAKVAPLPAGLPPAMKKGKKRKKTDQEKHADMLYYEYTLYNGYLREHGRVPKVPHGGYGDDQNLRYLIMTRLGPDVDAAQRKAGPWSIPRLGGYARQMLELLRCLHERCKMVFIDVKPENFMFGLPGSADADMVFLIDFGLSERYTGAGGTLKPQKVSSQVAGTPEFLSLRCHGGAGAGRCDDLESLGYVIISLMRGGSSPLPWSGSKSVADGLQTKRATSIEDLCQGLPAPMVRYMELVRGMAYEDTPDYNVLNAILQEVEKSGGAVSCTAGGGSGKGGSGGKSARRGASAPASDKDSDETGESSKTAEDRRSGKRQGKGKPPTRSAAAAAAAASAQESPEVPADRTRSRPRRGDSTRAVGNRRAKADTATVDGPVEVKDSDEEEMDKEEVTSKGKRSSSRRGATAGGTALPSVRAESKRAISPATKLPSSLSSFLGSGAPSDDKRKTRSTPTRGDSTKAKASPSSVASKGKTRAAKKRTRNEDDEGDDDGGEEEARDSDEESADAFFDARSEGEEGSEDESVMMNGDHGKGTSRAAKNRRRSGSGVSKTIGNTNKKGRPSTERPMQFRLEVISGPHKGDSLLMPAMGTAVRVGRGAPRRNGLRLDQDFEVSDRHSVLRVRPHGVECVDVGSLNGTFVNEDKMTSPSVLVDGDVLQFGQSSVRICTV